MGKRDLPRPIELLAPAADKEVAKAAILHGADAVYIGASSHGARSRAANSIEDIAEVVDFAHFFRARVYVTVNTLVYDNEIKTVERLVRDLYRIGVDALIVQDMALLEMHIPPIALHASTQCDTRTPEKARFLQDVGMSQIVLARELTLDEIERICGSVTVPVECFIHGALCVSYSGRCAASQVTLGRSANRGECAQMCRMPYTLRNADGEVLARDRYLLSLKDFNASAHVGDMIRAGVSSFKIEGRLKDAGYVKNVTAFYRRLIDDVIAADPERYCRSSYGRSSVNFIPQLDKSFNRGFTDYFLGSRRPGKMASLFTPKSMGEEIRDVSELRNGDGISFFNSRGEYEGVNVNGVRNGRIIGSRMSRMPKDAVIHRTSDMEFNRQLSGTTATRSIAVDMRIDESGLTLSDERGLRVRVPLDVIKEQARTPMQPEKILGRLGGTSYALRRLDNDLDPETFIPASELTRVRRSAIEALDKAARATYRYDYRREERPAAVFPDTLLDERSNVANRLAEDFYRDHGVKKMKRAVELTARTAPGREVMTTRYCVLRELGACRRECADERTRQRYRDPLTITTGPHTFLLRFDCLRCEMHVLTPEK